MVSSALAPSVHIDVPITNMSWSLMMRSAPTSLMAQPTLPVSKQSDIFPLYDPKELFRNTAHVLDFNTVQGFSSYGIGEDSYKVDLEAIEEILTFKDLQNMDSVLNLERWLAYQAAVKLKINMEQKFADVMFNVDSWKASTTYKIGRSYAKTSATRPGRHHFVDFGHQNNNPFNQATAAAAEGVAGSDTIGNAGMAPFAGYWDARAENGSSIVEDVQGVLAYAKRASGFKMNTAIMTDSTYRAIAPNGNLREYYKYTNSGLPPANVFAEWMGVDRVLLTEVLHNEEKSGMILDYVIPEGDILFLHCPDSVGLMMPACFQIFEWSGYFSDAIAGFRSATSTVGVRRIRDEIREAYIIRAYMPVQVKMVANIMGFYVRNAIKKYRRE